MDNSQNANISGGNLSVITSLDQNDQVRSHHDIMMRRLKNRERQRRYRARKRLAAERVLTSPPLQYLESDTKKAPASLPLPKEIKRRKRRKKESSIDQFTVAPIEMPLQYTEADSKKGPAYLPLPKELKRRRRRKKEITMDQFMPVHVQMPLNDTPQEFATQVHSRRDWKRDARRAHTLKEQERIHGPVIPVVTSVSASQVQSFASGLHPPNKECQTRGSTVDHEAQKMVPSRRHWKEEARNRKSQNA